MRQRSPVTIPGVVAFAPSRFGRFEGKLRNVDVFLLADGRVSVLMTGGGLPYVEFTLSGVPLDRGVLNTFANVQTRGQWRL